MAKLSSGLSVNANMTECADSSIYKQWTGMCKIYNCSFLLSVVYSPRLLTYRDLLPTYQEKAMITSAVHLINTLSSVFLYSWSSCIRLDLVHLIAPVSVSVCPFFTSLPSLVKLLGSSRVECATSEGT